MKSKPKKAVVVRIIRKVAHSGRPRGAMKGQHVTEVCGEPRMIPIHITREETPPRTISIRVTREETPPRTISARVVKTDARSRRIRGRTSTR